MFTFEEFAYLFELYEQKAYLTKSKNKRPGKW